MTDLERVLAALERIIGAPVQAISRATWKASLRRGGTPTLLPGPFPPYQGVQGNPGYECTVASAMPFAQEPGFHHVRSDLNDAPLVFNVDSHVVIEDLAEDRRWPEVLRVAGLQANAELTALVRGHVFAYVRQRDDHHSAAIPDDIAGAEPKEDAP